MHLTADHYNALRPGMVGSVESHDDPRPTSADAQRARVIAIREGRLRSVPRDEVVPLPPEVAPVAVTEPPTLPNVATTPEEITAAPTAPETPEPKGSESPDGS